MHDSDDRIDLRPSARERHPLFAAAWVSAAMAFLALVLALASRAIFDKVLTSHSMQSLAAIGAAIVIAIALDLWMRLLRSHWIEAVGEAYDARVARDLFRRLVSTRMSAMPRAAVASSLFREFEAVRDLHSTATVTALVDGASAILFLVVLFSITGPLALVTTAGMLVMGGAWLLQRRVERMAQDANPTLVARQTLLHESALGAEDVKLARAEGRLADEMGFLTSLAARDGAALRHVGSLVGVLVTGAATAVQSGMVAIGALLVIRGDITTGTLIAATILSGRAMAPASALAGAAMKVGRARSAAVTVRALADAPKEGGADGVRPAEVKGEIRLESVRFHYPGREAPALDGLTLALAPGEVVALVGARGCGKSTLGRLLCGLVQLDPQRDSGGVTLDGIPISQFCREALRRHVSACPQDATLFSRTILDNIRFARPEATDDEVLRAARIACADDWILRLPLGFATPVVEQGRTLSGGERQSIALARMVLSDPKVVFLDEPTAHFDPVSTRRFVENMRAWLPGRTAIVATHRPEVLPLCAKVVVMERGKVTGVRPPSAVLSMFGLAPAAQGPSAATQPVDPPVIRLATGQGRTTGAAAQGGQE